MGGLHVRRQRREPVQHPGNEQRVQRVVGFVELVPVPVAGGNPVVPFRDAHVRGQAPLAAGRHHPHHALLQPRDVPHHVGHHLRRVRCAGFPHLRVQVLRVDRLPSVGLAHDHVQQVARLVEGPGHPLALLVVADRRGRHADDPGVGIRLADRGRVLLDGAHVHLRRHPRHRRVVRVVADLPVDQRRIDVPVLVERRRVLGPFPRLVGVACTHVQRDCRRDPLVEADLEILVGSEIVVDVPVPEEGAVMEGRPQVHGAGAVLPVVVGRHDAARKPDRRDLHGGQLLDHRCTKKLLTFRPEVDLVETNRQVGHDVPVRLFLDGDREAGLVVVDRHGELDRVAGELRAVDNDFRRGVRDLADGHREEGNHQGHRLAQAASPQFGNQRFPGRDLPIALRDRGLPAALQVESVRPQQPGPGRQPDAQRALAAPALPSGRDPRQRMTRPQQFRVVEPIRQQSRHRVDARLDILPQQHLRCRVRGRTRYVQRNLHRSPPLLFRPSTDH